SPQSIEVCTLSAAQGYTVARPAHRAGLAAAGRAVGRGPADNPSKRTTPMEKGPRIPRGWLVVTGLAGLAVAGASVTQGADSPSAYQRAVLKSKPVAYWRLGEAKGPTARDATTGGHHGKYHGTPLFGQPGALKGDKDTSITLKG